MEKAGTRIRAILWDVGGTLLDRIDHKEALDRVLTAAGVAADRLHPDALFRAMQYYQERESTWRTPAAEADGFREIASLMVAGTEYSDPEHIEQLGRRMAHYDDVYFVVPGVREIVSDAHDAGLVQGIVTNWPPSLTRVLAYHKLDRYFRAIVESGQFGRLKPDPALFSEVLTRLGVEADAALFIGNDPDLDLAPARSIGMRVIHFDPRRQHADADSHEASELRNRIGTIVGPFERAGAMPRGGAAC